MNHSLTNKDKAELKATCSVCGPEVPIRRNGKYGFVCLEARREKSRRYKQNNPAKVKATKAASNPSTHRLTLRNGDLDTCAVCGEVQPVAWGRGWMCPTIPEEKGWTVVPVMNVRPRMLSIALLEELDSAGMHVEPGASALPTEIENVVPGWKTLGPASSPAGVAQYADPWRGRPVYVDPQYAALYGSG